MRTVSAIASEFLADLYDLEPALKIGHHGLLSYNVADLDRMQVDLERVCLDPSYRFRYLSLPTFDIMIEELARPELFSLDAREFQGLQRGRNGSLNTVILASEFYTQGGHRAVAERLLEDESVVLLLTDAFRKYERQDPSVTAPKLPLTRLDVIEASCVEDRVRAIIRQVNTRNPSECILLLHPQDVAGFIASTMLAKLILVKFIHHNDHSPTLGIHLKSFEHIDLFKFQADFCNAIYGYAQRVLPVWKAQVFELKVDRGLGFEIVLCGGAHKFADRQFCLYLEAIYELLKMEESCKIYHVGSLPNSIVRFIEQSPFSKNKYHYCGEVSNLDAFYDERNNPIYIESFPVGGAYSTISALSRGFPVLKYSEHRGSVLRNLPLLGLYPGESPVWQTPNELVQSVRFAIQNYEDLANASVIHYAACAARGEF